jgi:ubiquinone/menaquinone biosynthesis C-methylase UbiE
MTFWAENYFYMENKQAYTFTSKDAENYDYYLGPVLFEPYGQYLADQINGGHITSVLELACGTGRVTSHIQRALPDGAEFWATDLSSDMLDIAKRRLGSDQIHFKTEDIQNLSFADNTFDLVICQFGMMFLPDKQKGFDEIYRVLKPGGKFLGFTWNDTSKNPMYDLLIRELMLPWFPNEDVSRLFTPFSLYNPQQLAGWMKNSGFTSAKTETIALNSGPASAEHIENAIFLKHPLGKAVTDKGIDAFEIVAQKFKEEIARRYGHTVSFPMSALLTVGVK